MMQISLTAIHKELFVWIQTDTWTVHIDYWEENKYDYSSSIYVHIYLNKILWLWLTTKVNKSIRQLTSEGIRLFAQPWSFVIEWSVIFWDRILCLWCGPVFVKPKLNFYTRSTEKNSCSHEFMFSWYTVLKTFTTYLNNQTYVTTRHRTSYCTIGWCA